MYVANVNQIFKLNPSQKIYDFWVVFLQLKADVPKEIFIKEKHEDIETILFESNVNYSEITTNKGKNELYNKFNIKNKKHPLFLLLDKHPIEYMKDDCIVMIEWGKWKDKEEMSESLMALINFFDDSEFRQNLINSKNPKLFKKVEKFFKDHGLDLLKIGVTIAIAVG